MAPVISGQVNLAFQIVISILLLVSLALKQRRKHLAHATMMLAAVVLNVVSFFSVMLPSLLGMEILKTDPFGVISMVIIAHASLGVITGVFSVWLIASWHFQSSIQNCVRKKKIMRTTLILWLIVLFVGFILYYFLYGF
jgi:uncharacterized membrane protein YozB (DUF420 family)